MSENLNQEIEVAPENNLSLPNPSNKKLITFLVILTIIGFSSTAALISYMYASKTLPTTQNVDSISINSTEQQVTETTSNAPPSPKPSLLPSSSGNTFNSATLGLGFYYSAIMVGSNERVEVTEAGDTVYIHSQNQPKESGQFVKRFTKDPNISFEAAIKNQFLKNISEEKCFVELKAGKDKSIMTAEINYPVPANAEEPFFAYGEECPDEYKHTNGIRYFYYDATVPNAFFFFSIGQYGIPAYSNDSETLWQDTFQAF